MMTGNQPNLTFGGMHWYVPTGVIIFVIVVLAIIILLWALFIKSRKTLLEVIFLGGGMAANISKINSQEAENFRQAVESLIGRA